MGAGPTTASNADLPPIVDGTSAVANFGTLGVSDQEILSPATEAQFLDQFTVTGGTGPGTMTVDWSLDGTLALDGVGCSIAFDSVTFSELGAFGSSAVGTAGLSSCAASPESVNLSGSINVPFTYGTSFNGGFDLKGEANIGSLNFSSTGQITNVILPPGASLVALSGTIYPTGAATAVPEPASVLLLSTGLVALRSRRRRNLQRPRHREEFRGADQLP